MITELIILAIVLLIIYIIFKIVKNVIWLIINSVIGFFALFGLNFILSIFSLSTIKINFWSIIITAIGGIIGLIAITITHFLGIAF